MPHTHDNSSYKSTTSLHLIIYGLLACAVLLCLYMVGCDRTNSHGDEYMQIATIHRHNGEIIQAFEFVGRAQAEYSEAKDTQGEANALATLGLLYFLSGMQNEAYALMQEITPEQAELINDKQRANYYLIKAYLSGAIDNDFQQAKSLVDSLTTLHRKTDPENVSLHYLDLNNMIEILTLEGDTAQAWKLIKEMESNLVEDASGDYRHQMNVNKARLYYNQQKIDSAEKYARSILEGPLSETDDAYNRTLAWRIIMTSDSLRYDLKAYAQARDNCDHLRHEIMGNGAKYGIAVVQGRNEAEKILRASKHERTELLLRICLIAVFVAILFLLVLLKLREQKAKHRIALLECDRLDAEAFKRKLQCEVLDDKVKQQVLEIEKIQKENSEILRRLANSSDSSQDGGKLQALESLLKAEHSDFLIRLKTTYPQLSDYDCLVLGLIRMEMPSREIASVLSITPASLMKSRYRLRQKMQLQKSDDLNSVVMTI